VQLLNGALGHTPIVVIDESKSARPSGVAIGRNHDLQRIADRAEVLADVCFIRAVREISDE
jgi:hypothetical protein